VSEVRIAPATPADVPAILMLLEHSGLPTAGFADHLAQAIVACKSGRVVGSATLEMYGDDALLRSVTVDADERGTRIGHRLTEAALARARERGVRGIYLLTTTAEGFFPRFGFTVIDRSEVPEPVRQSIEFTSACPSSASAMRLRL
jgi:amino-acid N-acetyltransferase